MAVVGRLARIWKARVACTLILLAAPVWLRGTAAAMEPTPDNEADWPPRPPAPPVSQRLWPPPSPPPRARRPSPSPSTEASPDAEPAAPASPPPATPPPETATQPETAPSPRPEETAPAADRQPAPAVAPGVTPYAAGPAGGVYVELRSDDPNTRIDQVGPDGRTWPACVVPCRRILGRNITYVIQSDQAPPTTPFLLPDSTNQVMLDVQAGSQSKRTAGMVMVALGGIAAVFGLTRASATGSSMASSSNGSGLAIMGLGAAAAIVGVVLVKMSRTAVTSSTGATFTEGHEGDAKTRAAPMFALTPEGLLF